MLKIAHSVYLILPQFLKSVAISITGYRNIRKRKNAEFKKFLNEYEQLSKADYDDLLAYQQRKVLELLNEAITYSSYYSNIIIPKNGFRLSNIPFLEKDILKKRTTEFFSNNPKRCTKSISFTSGTTGSPMRVEYDQESINRSFALLERYYNNIGISEGDRRVRFSGRIIVRSDKSKPPYWVYNRAENQLFMSSYHLHDKNMYAYVEQLNRFKPQFIEGYPSAIFVLARFILRNRLKLNFSPKAISTTAETLYDNQREVIREAFSCNVYNQYASSEGGPFITECTEGRLHLNIDSGVFEFINSDGSQACEGELAEMVVTSFRSWKTPLIRYKTGDYVKLSKNQTKCPCGCNMPVIQEIIGRSDDILYTQEKGYVGRMDPVYKGLKGIIRSQINQYSLDQIEILQVVNEDYNKKVESKLISSVRERLGSKVDISIKIVDEIPLGKNGKFKSVQRKFTIN